MLYSCAGILALLIHIIINNDVIRKDSSKIIPAYRPYRAFLVSVLIYYVTDIFWGILYEQHMIRTLFLDTAVYFLAMSVSILFWTRYVVDYLEEEYLVGKVLKGFGWLQFLFELIILILNFFHPLIYSINEAGVYHAESIRYVTLVVQVAMFLLAAVYALIEAARRQGTMKIRHRTVGLVSLVMGGFIIAQLYFPLLPFYAIGYMLASCILHSFVLEDEKEEYRGELEKRLRDNIEKGNYYDLLTGLPGMTYFFELAEKKREIMKEEGGQPAFLFLDLSGMKFYNQKHGFAEGDRLLQTFAQLLTPAFGSDNCSRFGQDHFVVFTENEGLEDKLNDIFRAWEEKGIEEIPAIRVGVYLDQTGPVAARPAAEHMDTADLNVSETKTSETDIATACDRAKAARDSIRSSYISSIQYFDAPMLEEAERKQYIISHLDRAMEEGWIQVYYQPVVRAYNGRVCEEEALARWVDPERGFLSPIHFISILEDARLIYKLDLYVVDQVIEKLHYQEEAGLFLVPQSINLSRSDFDSCDIVEEIRQRVDRAGLPHSLFTIEITESIVGSAPEFMKKEIGRFRALGFPVWMDDFGSGYSSLDVLANIDVDLIKLDMRFMEHYDKGEKGKIILTELMRMAIGLDIDTLCEGVEREDQVEFLKEIGCARLQGFYYARPMPLSLILERYQKGTQIGFENPEEASYYDTIGRVNLFDLDVMTKDEENTVQHFFQNLPMGILEIRGDKTKFTRSNRAYQEFMEGIFHMSPKRFGGPYEEITDEPGQPFARMLMQVRREGGRTVFEEQLPDGKIIHSYIRRIAENPVTGTTAVAVAVLAVTDSVGRE